MVKIFLTLKKSTRMLVRSQETSVDTSYLNRMDLRKKCFGVVDWVCYCLELKTKNPKIINVKWKGQTSLPCPLHLAELDNPTSWSWSV